MHRARIALIGCVATAVAFGTVLTAPAAFAADQSVNCSGSASSATYAVAIPVGGSYTIVNSDGTNPGCTISGVGSATSYVSWFNIANPSALNNPGLGPGVTISVNGLAVGTATITLTRLSTTYTFTFTVTAGGSSASSSTPAPIVQQFGKPASGTCDAAAPATLNWAGVSSGGWGESWSQWMNGGNGGSVCTRTLVYSNNLGGWTIA